MTIRTTSKTITFNRPFCLKGVDRLLPPGDYRVVTDEELIEGLSFPAYHRISTVIFVPAQSGSAVEMVTIEPLDLPVDGRYLLLGYPAEAAGRCGTLTT
jgi:hypothetical protein